ncbi:MAG: type II secretion system protein [Rhodocyclaceae bacterium]|nr:type II secretion system protein [Rhodocyclaceae bacterium]
MTVLRACGGFTLIEMVVTLAIVGVLASVALPMAELAVQRGDEQELRHALRQIRTALDAYRQAVERGRVASPADASGYPPRLEALVEGVVDLHGSRGERIFFLRRLPRDPMHPDHTLADALTWGKRSYASSHDDPREGADVFDVYSLSDRRAIDGSWYREW